jgi:prepilin-type N-terminal cleavage/methylation domain-containing protein
MLKKHAGFTLVELLIVIVIIAILSVIAVLSYNTTQKNTRDSDRSSKAKIITDQLEKYYAKNGEYPSCQQMTQSGSQISTSVLIGIDPLALITPKAPSGTTNSIGCTALVEGSGTDTFAYVGDGSTNCSTGTTCLQFTFQYREEATGMILSYNSQHQTQINTSGTPTLTSTTASNTQINLTWTAVNNAINYHLQQASDSLFSVNLVNSTVTSTSLSVGGLTPGTTYYFRIAPNATSSQGVWSNTASATTTISPPTAPSTTAAMSGTNAIGTASSVACAVGTPQYQLQYSSTNTTTLGAWSSWTASGSPQTLTVATSQGYQYSFESHARCQGTNAASTASPTSNIASTIRPIDTPVAPTYLSPSQFYSNVYAIVNYASYCPSGTNLLNGTFRTTAWTGASWGPNPFGFNDSWQNVDGHDENVQYWGKYQCQTSYATSSYSPESYNVIVVHSS